MKKSLLSTMVFALLFTLTACASSMGDINDKTPVDESNSTTPIDESNNIKPTIVEEKSTDVSISEQILYDKDNIKITATELDMNGLFGPEIKVLIENNSTKDITVQTDKSSINGVMVDTLFSADVAASKKTNETITFSSSVIEHAALTTFKNFEFIVKILDPDSYETLDTTDFITIETSADPNYVQTFDTSGFVVLDEDNIKVIVKKLSSTDSFWGSDVYLYIENNTNKDITISADDVSIDGFMIDPYFAAEILAGKKAYDVMTFMESDLEENGITDIKSLEFKLNIYDSESYDDIKNTGVIKVDFAK